METVHLFEKILNALEQHDTPLKRLRLYGAVLLSQGEPLAFFDAFKMADRELNDDDLAFLCQLAEFTKEPKIVEPLIYFTDLLPKASVGLESLEKIYNILALLYGQAHDTDNLEKLWRRLLDDPITSRRLYSFRHFLHRIRHFYRVANVLPPPEFTDLMYRMNRKDRI